MHFAIPLAKYMLFWFGLHWVVPKLIKMPPSIQKIQNPVKRLRDYNNMIKDHISLIHAPAACYFAGRLLLRDPKVFNEVYDEEY